MSVNGVDCVRPCKPRMGYLSTLDRVRVGVEGISEPHYLITAFVKKFSNFSCRSMLTFLMPAQVIILLLLIIVVLIIMSMAQTIRFTHTFIHKEVVIIIIITAVVVVVEEVEEE